MTHILVLPQDLLDKLNVAQRKTEVKTKWQSIGISTSNEMLLRIISDMNNNFYKLNISGYRFESKDVIKSKVGNLGRESVYAGYLENENATIDGLFFYIPPTLDSANDILSRQVIPSLMGIYSGISSRTKDLHFNSRPVYIVNINELSRMEQRSVKVGIISARLMGFNYLDIYKNEFEDIINDGTINSVGNIITFNNLITADGIQNNDLFEMDTDTKMLKILPTRLSGSSNITAEIYRFCLRIIPAIYLATNEKYRIDISMLSNLTTDWLEIIKTYISKFIKEEL